MLIYDIEELIQRAKKHYYRIKAADKDIPVLTKELQEINKLLFTDATAVNLEALEIWLDEQDDKLI